MHARACVYAGWVENRLCRLIFVRCIAKFRMRNVCSPKTAARHHSLQETLIEPLSFFAEKRATDLFAPWKWRGHASVYEFAYACGCTGKVEPHIHTYTHTDTERVKEREASSHYSKDSVQNTDDNSPVNMEQEYEFRLWLFGMYEHVLITAEACLCILIGAEQCWA